MPMEVKEVRAVRALMIGMVGRLPIVLLEQAARMLIRVKASPDDALTKWAESVSPKSPLSERTALVLVKMAQRYFEEFECGQVPRVEDEDAWLTNNKLSEFEAKYDVLRELLAESI